MPADRIKKTKIFGRIFECQIMDKKNAIRSKSVLNQNTVKVYTDGSKLDGRVGAGFYAEYPKKYLKQAFFHHGIHSTVFQAEVLAISEMAKNLLLEKMHDQGIVVLVDSQAGIKSLIKCTVTSITVLNCIRNLNQLGEQNYVSISWITGHARVHGNEVADYLAKSGSKSKLHGPEPFITVPYASCAYASCVSTVKDWSTDRSTDQDLNQNYMVLNLLLQSRMPVVRMPVVLARLRTGPQIDGNLCGMNGKTA